MYLCINVFVECPFSSLQYVQHVRTLSSVMIVAREGRLEQGSHPPIFLTDQLPLFQPGGGQIIRLLIVPPHGYLDLPTALYSNFKCSKEGQALVRFTKKETTFTDCY